MVLAMDKVGQKVLRVSASSAPNRAHNRYDFAPARRPVARPEPAQRTAGALPVQYSQSSGSWHGL
eukprot:scaffold9247_cov133-Isochrysis_galbana.AAC.1